MAVVFLLMTAAVIWMFVEDHCERKKIDSIKAENEELRKNCNIIFLSLKITERRELYAFAKKKDPKKAFVHGGYYMLCRALSCIDRDGFGKVCFPKP